MRVSALIAAASLVSRVLAAGRLAEAQACTPKFGVVTSWGPVGATILGTWDFDRDGHPDLLVQDGTSVRVALNLGAGRFELGPSVFEGSVAVGDFDSDGVLDLLGVEQNTSLPLVAFLKGDGHGGFHQASSFHASTVLLHPVAGDFDGDGRLDFAAVAGPSSNYVWWYRGDGHGGFSPASAFQPSTALYTLDALDADGDGRSDLVVGVALFKGSSLRTFTLGPAGLFVESADGPDAGGFECAWSLAFGDVDGDGRTDVVSVNSYLGGCRNSVRTYLVRPGTGVHIEQETEPFVAPVLADLDGDGKIDLAALYVPLFASTASGLAILTGNGKGTFGPASIYAVPPVPSPGAAILTAVEIDGWPDLLLSGVPGFSPRFLRNSCRGGHRAASPGPTHSPRSRGGL